MDDLITQLRALSGDPRLSDLVDTILQVRNTKKLPYSPDIGRVMKQPDAAGLGLPELSRDELKGNIPRSEMSPYGQYWDNRRYGVSQFMPDGSVESRYQFNKGEHGTIREGVEYEPASGRSKNYDRDWGALSDIPRGRRTDHQRDDIKRLESQMDEEYYYLVERAEQGALTSQEKARFAELADRLGYDPNIPVAKGKKQPKGIDDQIMEELELDRLEGEQE